MGIRQIQSRLLNKYIQTDTACRVPTEISISVIPGIVQKMDEIPVSIVNIVVDSFSLTHHLSHQVKSIFAKVAKKK